MEGVQRLWDLLAGGALEPGEPSIATTSTRWCQSWSCWSSQVLTTLSGRARATSSSRVGTAWWCTGAGQ